MSGYDIPYVPSSDEKTAVMMRLANIKEGEKAVDLGSGEGKLVMALAASGADTVGIEIDRGRSITSVSRIFTAGLEHKAHIIRGSFWEHDLSPYDVIVLYGVPSIMERLQQKIMKEAKKNCRIVSNYFEFPDWQPMRSENNVHLYVPLANSLKAGAS